MVIRIPTIEYNNSGDKFHILLASDHHIGHVDCDKKHIIEDLEWVKKNKGMAFFNGDLSDLIFPQDSKRFNINTIDKALLKSHTVLNNQLDLIYELLEPYAENIMIIGEGNHETAISKYHSTDFNQLLIERLRAKSKSEIYRGGYTGAIVMAFRKKSGTGISYKIFYHHGLGSYAPVTKGMIDFNRFAVSVSDADIIWLGHKHNRFVDHSEEIKIPSSGNTLRTKKILHIMTGAYLKTSYEQIIDGKYNSNWSIEKGFAPQGRGGIRLILTVRTRDKYVDIDTEVIM